MKSLVAVFLFCIFSPSVYSQDPDIDEILEVLSRQQECWTSGDIDCFMVGYWQSDELKFVGASGITYGYQNTLDRYKKSYPTKEDMGELTFEVKELDQISKDCYSMVGKFHLKRTIGDAEGHFTLLWRKIDGNWVIVMDHTSAMP